MSYLNLAKSIALAAVFLSVACEQEIVPAPPPPPDIEGECVGKVISSDVEAPTAGEAPETPQEVGTSAPVWSLSDEQPLSCNYQKIYGLEQYRGTPTMMVLLYAGCGFCQAQTELLHQMKGELDEENVDVNFAIINQDRGADLVLQLSNRCTFPIFQDTESVNAWGLHGGNKDDFYFYDAEGVLQTFLSPGKRCRAEGGDNSGAVQPCTSDDDCDGEATCTGDNIRLATEEGYANIKNAVLALTQ